MIHFKTTLALVTAALCTGTVLADVPPPKPKDAKDAKEDKSKEVVLLDRIQASLKWLGDHQNFEGYWSGAGFGADTTRKTAKRSGNLEFVNPAKENGDAGWSESVDIGLTGLSLLSFTGAGHDHTEGDYKANLRRGIMYLRKVQSNDGCFGPKDEDSFVYNHAIATMALCEDYALSADGALKSTCERAVQFILDAQNPGKGWRYGVKTGENDTSFTGWAVMALKSAKMAGLELDDKAAFDGASSWLDSVTVEEKKGEYCTGYNSPGSGNARLRAAQNYETNPTMDAINICARLFMGRTGWDTNSKVLKFQAGLLTKNLPKWEHAKIDYIYWYWGTLAAYQYGGDTWIKWAAAIKPALTDNQRGWRKEDKDATAETLDEHGSWDAVDAWAAAGGRVYGTAVNCLMLEILQRYERLAPKKKEGR
ncbi:MAG: terpene cyclase/mutase family protein [Planctomycetes bacterium]|nr:terpene cyclase/mutase family protein [Planctomycetota bacterium]